MDCRRGSKGRGAEETSLGQCGHLEGDDDFSSACDNDCLHCGDDEAPRDIRAFFGHPLTAAEHAADGEALALLHEYRSLPAISKSQLPHMSPLSRFSATDDVSPEIQQTPANSDYDGISFNIADNEDVAESSSTVKEDVAGTSQLMQALDLQHLENTDSPQPMTDAFLCETFTNRISPAVTDSTTDELKDREETSILSLQADESDTDTDNASSDDVHYVPIVTTNELNENEIEHRDLLTAESDLHQVSSKHRAQPVKTVTKKCNCCTTGHSVSAVDNNEQPCSEFTSGTDFEHLLSVERTHGHLSAKSNSHCRKRSVAAAQLDNGLKNCKSKFLRSPTTQKKQLLATCSAEASSCLQLEYKRAEEEQRFDLFAANVTVDRPIKETLHYPCDVSAATEIDNYSFNHPASLKNAEMFSSRKMSCSRGARNCCGCLPECHTETLTCCAASSTTSIAHKTDHILTVSADHHVQSESIDHSVSIPEFTCSKASDSDLISADLKSIEGFTSHSRRCVPVVDNVDRQGNYLYDSYLREKGNRYSDMQEMPSSCWQHGSASEIKMHPAGVQHTRTMNIESACQEFASPLLWKTLPILHNQQGFPTHQASPTVTASISPATANQQHKFTSVCTADEQTSRPARYLPGMKVTSPFIADVPANLVEDKNRPSRYLPSMKVNSPVVSDLPANAVEDKKCFGISTGYTCQLTESKSSLNPLGCLPSYVVQPTAIAVDAEPHVMGRTNTRVLVDELQPADSGRDLNVQATGPSRLLNNQWEESSSADSQAQKMHPSNTSIPQLPFPLPPVPPGYRLVITHHSLPSPASGTSASQQVTQLVIDHPHNQALDVAVPSHSKPDNKSTDFADVDTHTLNNCQVKEKLPVRPQTLDLHLPVNKKDDRICKELRPSPDSGKGSSISELPLSTKMELESPKMEQAVIGSDCKRNPFHFSHSSHCRSGANPLNSSAVSPVQDILEQSLKAAKVLEDGRSKLVQKPGEHVFSQLIPSGKAQHSRSLPTTPLTAISRPTSECFADLDSLHRSQRQTEQPRTPLLSHISPTVHNAPSFSSGRLTDNDEYCTGNAKKDNNNNTSVSKVCEEESGILYKVTSPLAMQMSSVMESDVIQNQQMSFAVDSSGEDHRNVKDRREEQDLSRLSSPATFSVKSEILSKFKGWSHISVIPKLEPDVSGYQFYLEASISTNRRLDEDRLTYLNKGQYYGLVLKHKPSSASPFAVCTSGILRSVVMVQFRERHSPEEQQKAWEFWHMRQHSYKQRVIDVDSKTCDGAEPVSIEEIAYNAVAIVWNSNDQFVKVNIAVNCLSTDFSHQKGVKGSPLHLQIDTFEDEWSAIPAHRAYSQIKVFCDKGADRKSREEERKLLKTAMQGDLQECQQKPCDRTYFYAMADLTTQPVLFHPQNILNPKDTCHMLPRTALSNSGYDPLALGGRRVRSYSYDNIQLPQRVLLYVREEHDRVFTALLLDYPTVRCLKMAIQEKYHIEYKSIQNVYTRSKKCMLVRMDDNFVKHFANESTFIIHIERTHSLSSSDDLDVGYDVTLTEIDVQTSADKSAT